MSNKALAMAVAGLVAASLCGAHSVEAQMFKGGPQTMLPRNHDACSVEAQTLCAGVIQTHGAVRECLAIHQSQLSPACRKSMSQMRSWSQFHPAAHR